MGYAISAGIVATHTTYAHGANLRNVPLIRSPIDGRRQDRVEGSKKWLRKSEQGDKWNRCLIEGMIVLSETGARDEQTTPP